MDCCLADSSDGSKIAVLYDFGQNPSSERAMVLIADSSLSNVMTYPLGVFAGWHVGWAPDDSMLHFFRYNVSGTDDRYSVRV